MKQFLQKHTIAIVSAALLVLAILILIFVPNARMLGVKQFVVGGLVGIALWESPKIITFIWEFLKWSYKKVFKK